MKAIVHIWLKKDVLDPQGTAIMKTLNMMEFGEVQYVRQGKIFELHIDETNQDKALKRVQQMCKTLLANEIIENYTINLDS